jgi:nickel/cobalt transporter (NicO) family protein
MTGLTLALVAAAASLGSVHTLAPDHWMPFAALARAEGWTSRRTAAITALCGLGHVTVSVLLGLVSALLGLELLQTIDYGLESVAGVLLIAFGVVYGLWGLHRAVQSRWHEHDHVHGHTHWHGGHQHPHGHARLARLTPWMLFLVFCADPCVAVIPLMFAAAPLGSGSTLAVVAAYELATIGTMVALVLPARAVATAVRSTWADRYGDVLAGGVIASVGLVVVSLGL